MLITKTVSTIFSKAMLDNTRDLARIDYSPLSPEHQGNPYEYYATARQEYPVFYSPMLKLWIVTR